MTSAPDPQPDGLRTGPAGAVVISLDAMGGDRGPAAVVAGLAQFAAANSDASFVIHGPQDDLTRMLAKRPALAARSARPSQG